MRNARRQPMGEKRGRNESNSNVLEECGEQKIFDEREENFLA